MIIEILYPRLCCLYGDKGNTKFLQACLPDTTFIHTGLNDRPAFLDKDVDLCCMYSMSEQSQEIILDRLMPYKADIAARFAEGKTLFLLTGNALELFGDRIEREDGTAVPALGVYDFYVKRHAPNRFNTLLRGTFENMTLLGYTSRFSNIYGIPEEQALCTLDIGAGSDPATAWDGLYTGRVIATYMLGPLLVANPDLTKWLLTQLGITEPTLPFEEALYQSYEMRRKEYERPDLALD